MFRVVVVIAITAGCIGFALGILAAGLYYSRRAMALDAREGELALAEMRQHTAPIATPVARSIVKPRDANPRGPAADESPAEPVRVYATRAGELLASAKDVAARWRRSISDGMTSELMSVAYPTRRERTHIHDESATALIVRLRTERAAATAEAVKKLEDARS